MLHLFQQAERNAVRIAIRENDACYSYHDLLHASKQLAACLLNGDDDLHEARVAFMVAPGFDYVKVLWGIWLAGGTAVPLAIHPLHAIRHVVEDTGADVLVVHPEFREPIIPLCKERTVRLVVLDAVETPLCDLPDVHPSRNAMILYTSGTTSLPKGVVTTHQIIEAQIVTLVKAWQWNENDHTLCVLPLHHVHGIINIMSCALWAGACCEFLPAFSSEDVYSVFQQGRVTVFMAVPTVYYKLISHWSQLSEEQQLVLSDMLSSFRLMVSGSAALPVHILNQWQKISHHVLLERYGMTEIGMALSNPYKGTRKPGTVGLPLSDVQIRLCDTEDKPVVNEPGEIQVKGPCIFKEYWRNKEATEKAFTADGWFRTGDVAEVDSDGYYKILGRSSQDIIKVGGYKVSSLEIEEELRMYPGITDCSIIGIEDEEWGERIAAALITTVEIDLHALNTWLRTRLPSYKVPRIIRVVSELPRNAMGKVVKPLLKERFQP